MDGYLEIVGIHAREILDSRGNPTVATQVMIKDHGNRRFITAEGMVPSGASTGKFEAVELRDKEDRYQGKGVQKAVNQVNLTIDNLLRGQNAMCQYKIDELMIAKDGTTNKAEIGANAILSVSLGVARGAAQALHIPFYRYLGGTTACTMPVPMMNILNGGAHAQNQLDFQEFMIVPVGACCFKEALRMGTEVYHCLRRVLTENKLNTAVGDEGGFAPEIRDAREAFDFMDKAVRQAGYEPGKDICYAMDAAASELYSEEKRTYQFKKAGGQERNTKEMIAYYAALVEDYPLISIEDPLDQEDWEGWREITKALGSKVQLVGDDLFVTNTKRLNQGIHQECGNAILIKLNQIGTLTETLEAIRMAKRYGFQAIISHRSGETEDTTIADLAVATNCGQIKTGAPCRTERVAKYNRLLQIEEELGREAVYPGRKAFER